MSMGLGYNMVPMDYGVYDPDGVVKVCGRKKCVYKGRVCHNNSNNVIRGFRRGCSCGSSEIL